MWFLIPVLILWALWLIIRGNETGARHRQWT